MKGRKSKKNKMKKFIGKVKNVIAPILPLAISLPVLALAQTGGAPAGSAPTVLAGGMTDVASELCVVFNWMFYFLVIFAVIFIIVAAFKYLFAAGDPEKVKSAGHSLIYAAVAIVVAIIAKAVPAIVGSLLGAGTPTSC